jgi:hypothetical protein
MMTLPRSAADVLSGHVLFEIEAIDRLYLNPYQPRLQHGGGIASFFVGHRGNRFASSALMAPMTAAFRPPARRDGRAACQRKSVRFRYRLVMHGHASSLSRSR